MLRDIVQSMKEVLTHNQQPSLLLPGKYNNSQTDDGFLGDLGSIDNIGEKSCYIQFGIQQPDDI